MMLSSGLNDAGKIAERIRLNIEKSSLKIQDKELKVNISLGVATWPICRASNSSELISYADRALYFAKEHGRNQVILYDGNSFIKYAG
jgi:diguanylate cyclase (GGDEF)-like protein